MRLAQLASMAAFSFCFAGGAMAQSLEVGSYLCSVEQKAGVRSTHLEHAGQPEAFADSDRYRFRIEVSAGPRPGTRQIIEAPYRGAEMSRYQWEDDNSTLHTTYVGDGREFTAVDSLGFLSVSADRWGEGLQFYHAGFEFGGGEDRQLSVRWGQCARE
jgi:hypothetical protein